MEITELCNHTYSRWDGRYVRCAVCSMEIGTKFPPHGSPAYNALRGTFETKKYTSWMWEQTRNTVASTFTINPHKTMFLDDDGFIVELEDL